MFDRALVLPKGPKEHYFLWGPRQTGKTTLLKAQHPEAMWIDLLKAEEYKRYLDSPEFLRRTALTLPENSWIVIDEVQKVPQLLDEVHWLIENQHVNFALCGSSARKVKRGHANLLGGRALRFELFGLVYKELLEAFDLTRALNHGYLPRHYLSDDPQPRLRSYVADYLKEEIAAEGLTRNLPGFSSFLSMAALGDTEQVSYTTIARDCGVSGPTVKSYFQILEDTLLGTWLPVYAAKAKRRISTSPKFYFFDVGVVNHLARRGQMEPGSELYGKALENWVFHELNAYNHYAKRWLALSFWRLTSGIEVDFVVGNLELAIEVKATARPKAVHFKGLRELNKEHANLRQRLLVCLESKAYQTEDGIWVLPAQEFAQRLWQSEFF